MLEIIIVDFRKEGLNELGIQFREEFIKYADYYEDIAYEKTTELLMEHPEITALFCASDLMALGALKAIREMGRTGAKKLITMLKNGSTAPVEYLAYTLRKRESI